MSSSGMMSRHSTAVYWRALKYVGHIRGFAGCTWTSALGLHARVRVGMGLMRRADWDVRRSGRRAW